MGRDDDFGCGWLNHPLWNFQRGSAWRSNYDPLTAPNRVVDDLQFLSRIGVKSIVNRNSGTIGILKCCCSRHTFTAWSSTEFTLQTRTANLNSTSCPHRKTPMLSALRPLLPRESSRC